MDFVLARFIDGKVKAAGWWAPRPGQKVWLSVDYQGDLVVDWEHCAPDAVPYTWPRRSYAEAAALAWRHYQRRAATQA